MVMKKQPENGSFSTVIKRESNENRLSLNRSTQGHYESHHRGKKRIACHKQSTKIQA